MNKTIFLLLIAFAISKNLRELKIENKLRAGLRRLYDRHDLLRQKHQVAPFAKDTDIEKRAQDFAETLAKKGVFERSDGKYNGEDIGENLYLMMSSGEPTFTGDDVMDKWLESSNYDFNNPGFTEKDGHFTQIVWKSSTKVGCGAAKGPIDGWNGLFVICNYYPAGNINNVAYFKENVLPPK